MTNMMARCFGTPTLVLAFALFVATERVRAQCSGGMHHSSGMPSMMVQQVALLTAVQQQQQQVALMAAVQQQQQSVLRYDVRREQAALRADLRRQERQQAQSSATAALRTTPRLEHDDVNALPETADEIAARKVRSARELFSDADFVKEKGEQGRAARMRQRANERLQEVLGTYSGTSAAGEAQEMLAALNRSGR